MAEPTEPGRTGEREHRLFGWRNGPSVTPSERSLLLLLGSAAFFNRYDQGLFSLLLVQIQADLAIAEADVGFLGSIVRLGSVPAVALSLLADRVGRRRLLLWTIAGYTATTAATAFAPNAESFVALQFLSRMFVTAEFGLGFVVVVEEFRAENRGWGIAVLGILSGLGFGLSMILFSAIEEIPYGWRGLYGVGVLPLLLVLYLRRRLPETRRFEALRAEEERAGRRALGAAGWLHPVRVLIGRYPGRFAAMACVAFCWSFSNAPVDFLLPKFCQEALGWSPDRFALVALVGGGLGLSGQALAGYLSDRYGRKPNAVAFLLAEPIFAISLYAAFSTLAIPLYTVWVFASVGSDVAGRTYNSELFPTSARSTAAAALGVVGALGGVLGLASESLLFAELGSHWSAVKWIAAVGFVVPLVVAVAYPETSGKALEEIAPE